MGPFVGASLAGRRRAISERARNRIMSNKAVDCQGNFSKILSKVGNWKLQTLTFDARGLKKTHRSKFKNYTEKTEGLTFPKQSKFDISVLKFILNFTLLLTPLINSKMPTITVVVQRQWSIAPMLSVSNPNTTLLNPITAKIGEKEMRQRARTVVSEAYGPNKTLLRSGRQQFNKEDAALMRELKELPGDILMNGTNYKRKTSLLTQLTDPTLIARFVSFYNTTKDPKYLKECEVQAREMIRRLKHLALNIIQDTADDVEEKVKEYSHTKDADIENPVYNQNLGKMRGKKYGASGRHIHESADTILKLMENSQKMKKTTYEFGCKAQKSLAIFLGLENDIFKTDILTTILRSLDEGDAVTDPALVKEEIDSLIVLVREMEHNFNHDFALQVNSRRKEDRAEKYLQVCISI